MTTDVEALAKRLGVQAEQIAAEGHFGWGNLDTEAADALRSQAELIGRLESLRDAHIVSIREHIHKQWAAEERAKALEAKCALLAASLGQSESLCADLEQDARRYRWLRRRCFMIYASIDASFILHFFNEEGPTGEFLDDVVDSALGPQAGSKEGE